MRPVTISLLMVVCGYFSLGVLNNVHHVYRYRAEPWAYYGVIASPYLLTLLSAISAYHCFVWRRMKYRRQPPMTHASRGLSGIRFQRDHPSILERLCAGLFLLGVAAILRHQNIPHILVWIGLIVGLWWLCKALLLGARS